MVRNIDILLYVDMIFEFLSIFLLLNTVINTHRCNGLDFFNVTGATVVDSHMMWRQSLGQSVCAEEGRSAER